MWMWEEMMITRFFNPDSLVFYASRQPLQTWFVTQRQAQRLATGRQSMLPVKVLQRQQVIYEAINASTKATTRSTWGRA